MKEKTAFRQPDGTRVKRPRRHISPRYTLAVFLTLFETVAAMALVVVAIYFVNWLAYVELFAQLVVSIAIVNTKANPDFTIPWLVIVLVLPVAGIMIYFLYYSRKLPNHILRQLENAHEMQIKDDTAEMAELEKRSVTYLQQARQICRQADSHLYRNTEARYYALGDYVPADMMADLRAAQRYIFVYYFTIEEGEFWNPILEILKEKVKAGVEVRLIYDDVGCFLTLPGNYYKKLRGWGIHATPFAKLRGIANNEFNNRSHRKMLIVDGKVAYTGGVNLQDRYINRHRVYGHWKDSVFRIRGEAVKEMVRMFLVDYSLTTNETLKPEDYGPFEEVPQAEGFFIPFGSGPRPVYESHAAKAAILNMVNMAKRYVFITTPYLVIDQVMTEALENAAVRGVDVRIITPHIPDKKLVFSMTQSWYGRLIEQGVHIYEYEPGFIHAKLYIADDEVGIVGTVNLDYRSLVHHFENSVWFYDAPMLQDIKEDFLQTQKICISIEKGTIKETLFRRFIRAVFRIFAPLM